MKNEEKKAAAAAAPPPEEEEEEMDGKTAKHESNGVHTTQLPHKMERTVSSKNKSLTQSERESVIYFITLKRNAFR